MLIGVIQLWIVQARACGSMLFVCPKSRTPIVEAECKKNPNLDGAIKALSPLGRAAELEEVAGVILFLSGSSASYVTGTGLVIYAGLTMTVHLT